MSAIDEQLKEMDARLMSVPLKNIITLSIDKDELPRIKHIKSTNYMENYITTEVFYKPMTRYLPE